MDPIQELYNHFKNGNDLGTIEEFRAFMSNGDNVKRFHDNFKKGNDLGTIEEFNKYLSPQKKNPVGSGSSPGPSRPKTAPVAATSSGESFDPSSLLTPNKQEIPQYVAAPKTQWQWGDAPGIKQPSTATNLGIETDAPATVPDNKAFIKKVENRIALSNVRDSRNGDYQSDAVERMDMGLSEKEKQELSEKSLLEKVAYDTDITLKRYNAELNAIKEDQTNLSNGLEGIDQEISESLGENAFADYEKNIESYKSLKEKYDLASKSSDPTSVNRYVDDLNDLQSEIEKFQQHPLVQERSQMVKAMQKNLDRFKGMESDERYKGIRSLESDRKAIQGQVDEQDFMSDFSGMVIRSIGNMAAGIGRTAKNVNEMVWGEDAEPTPVSNFLIDLGDGANFLFPSPSQYSRGLVTDTAKWNGYEVDFKGEDVQAVRKNGKAVDMQLTDEQISEIKGLEKSKQVNWSVAPYQAANVIVDMGVMLAGADKITKGLTALGVTEKVAARTGVALSTAGQMSNGMYEQGLELFDGDKQKAAEYSFFGALAVGAVQNVFGMEQRLLTGRVLDTKSLAAAVGKMTPKQVAVEAVKMMGKEALGEGFEEGVIENFVTAMAQYTIGGKTDIDTTQMISDGAMGFAVGSLFAGGNVNMNEIQKSSLYNAAKDPVAFGNALREAVEKGEIKGDEDFISQQTARVSRVGAELEKLSPDLKQEEILDATALIDARIKYEARLDEVRGNTDLEQRYQAELDILNEALASKLVPPTPEVQQKISENQEEDGEGAKTTGNETTIAPEPVAAPEARKPAEPTEEEAPMTYTPVMPDQLTVGETYRDPETDREYVFTEESDGVLWFDKVAKPGEVLMNTRADMFKDSLVAKRLQKPIQQSTANPANAPANQESVSSGAATAEGEVLGAAPTESTTEPGGVKKRVLTERAYEGDTHERVKTYLEEKGLTREKVSQENRSAQAKQMVDDLGEDAAVEAVRTNQVKGALASATLFDVIKRVDERMMAAENEADMDVLAQKQADLIEMLNDRAFEAGEFNSQFAREYIEADIGWNKEVKKHDYVKKFGSISPEVEAKFEALDVELKELKARLAEAEKRASEAADAQAIETIKSEATKKKPTKETISAKGKKIAENIRKGRLSRPGTFSAASPASLVWDAAIEIAALTVESGANIAEAIQSGLRHIRNSDWYKGLSRSKQEDAEQDYIDFLSEQESTVGQLKVPKSLIRELVEGGVDNVPDLVEGVRQAMGLEEETDREIRDAITEYEKVINMTKDDIGKEVSRLKTIGKLLSKIEDAANGIRPKRTGLQRPVFNKEQKAEIRGLERELRERMKELPSDSQADAKKLLTALDAKKNRIKNRIEDIRKAISENKKIERSQNGVGTDAELESLEAELKTEEENYQNAFADLLNEEKERKRLESAKKSTRKSITELEKRLADRDFAKKERKPLLEDSELIDLRAEKLRIREEYDKEFYKAELANMKDVEKFKDALWQAWGFTRVLSASLDASFMFVQGGILTVSNPKMALEAAGQAMEQFKSESKSEEFIRNIKSQDWYPLAKQSKLALTEAHASMKASEEFFFSNWTETLWKLPSFILGRPFGKAGYERVQKANPFKATERAAVAYLDTLRILKFQEMLDGPLKGKNFSENKKEFQDVADAINTLTGRASLGKLEAISQPLTKLVFSPRNWASQVKLFSPYNMIYFGQMSPSARKMALISLGKFIAFNAGMMGLLAAYFNNDDDDETGVEFDPRSSDFLKMKLGDTRVDPWGGKIQQVTFASRMFMEALYSWEIGEGGFKNNKGEILPLGVKNKTPTQLKLTLDQFFNKLSPSARIVYNRLKAERDKEGNLTDGFGNEYSLSGDISKSLYPMFIQTATELAEDGFDTTDSILMFLAFMGYGVNTYGKKDDKKK